MIDYGQTVRVLSLALRELPAAAARGAISRDTAGAAIAAIWSAAAREGYAPQLEAAAGRLETSSTLSTEDIIGC